MSGEGRTINILLTKACKTVFWCVCVVTGVCGNLVGQNPAVIWQNLSLGLGVGQNKIRHDKPTMDKRVGRTKCPRRG
jgi:hypothetical protein